LSGLPGRYQEDKHEQMVTYIFTTAVVALGAVAHVVVIAVIAHE
jgi:hypothetical protein